MGVAQLHIDLYMTLDISDAQLPLLILVVPPHATFFHFPLSILSSTLSEISSFSFQMKLYGLNIGGSKCLFNRLMLLCCSREQRDLLLQ